MKYVVLFIEDELDGFDKWIHDVMSAALDLVLTWTVPFDKPDPQEMEDE